MTRAKCYNFSKIIRLRPELYKLIIARTTDRKIRVVFEIYVIGIYYVHRREILFLSPDIKMFVTTSSNILKVATSVTLIFSSNNLCMTRHVL